MIEILNNLNLLTFAKRKTSSIRGQSLFILIIMITGHLFLILHWLNTHVGQMKLFFAIFSRTPRKKLSLNQILFPWILKP